MPLMQTLKIFSTSDESGEMSSPGADQGLQQWKHKVLLAPDKLEVLSTYSCAI